MIDAEISLNSEDIGSGYCLFYDDEIKIYFMICYSSLSINLQCACPKKVQ